MIVSYFDKLSFFLFSIDLVLLNFSLLFVGLVGIVVLRHNFISILMSIEIIFLATSLNFIVFGVSGGDLIGQLAALLLLTVAAAESAIALAIIISYYRFVLDVEQIFVEKI